MQPSVIVNSSETGNSKVLPVFPVNSARFLSHHGPRGSPQWHPACLKGIVKCLNPLVLLLASLAMPMTGKAIVLYTYDFPGPSPNNSLAANQTNPQPPNAAFSDFTRQGGLQATDSNVLGSKAWTPGPVIDLAQYEGFTIASNVGYVLNLGQISFDLDNPIDGPANFQIRLYLDNSSTAFETSPTYNTQGVATTLTWDFTDVITADNVGTAEFRFFGWDTPSNGSHLTLDNVATSGAVVVPEPKQGALILFIFLGAVLSFDFRRRRRATRAK